MSLPPIFVINLERSKARRQHMEKELARFGVDYRFFPAVDGKKLRKEDYKCYSAKQSVALNGRVLSNAEIGCTLSHARVYEKMVAENLEEVLVLEDDCAFDDSFFEVLKGRQEWLPSGWSLVNFIFAMYIDAAARRGEHMEGSALLREFSRAHRSLQLIALKGAHWLAACYLINLHAAQQLLEIMYPIRKSSDGIISVATSKLKLLNVYTLAPALVQLAPLKSTLQGRPKLESLRMIAQALLIAIRTKDKRKPFLENLKNYPPRSFVLFITQKWILKTATLYRFIFPKPRENRGEKK